MQYEEMLSEEVENQESLFTCNGKPKIIDKETNKFDEIEEIYNCQYCECTDCKHWKVYNDTINEG